MRFRRLLGAGCVVAFAACAAPGYDASKLRTELRRAGVGDAQARCVIDAFEKSFDLHVLGLHAAPQQETLDKARAILERCGVKNLRPRHS